MSSSKYLATFEEKIGYWNKSLGSIDEVYRVVGEVFRSWSFLENLFIHSDEVKKELPKESTQFVSIDKEVRDIFSDGFKKKKAIDFCTADKVLSRLEEV
jgi:dynein heavy chain